MRATNDALYIGVDIGTSGCRAIVIDGNERVLAESRVPLPAPVRSGPRLQQSPEIWLDATQNVVEAVLQQCAREQVVGICVDGTSGTVGLFSAEGKPLGPALMYNDASNQDAASRIAALAPANSGAIGVSSSLAKVLSLLEAIADHRGIRVLHQADWIAGSLAGNFTHSDENNCLKLGYDPVTRTWPRWIAQLLPEFDAILPRVVIPGTPIGTLTPRVAQRWRLRPDVTICAGTTDSIAAFIASGARDIGDAVTSLGSTMVLKVISDEPVFSPAHGVYSHRLGERWLAGGASNAGGAILLELFGRERLEDLSARLEPERPTGLCYYPLTVPGERFPVADPHKQPVLTPRPESDVRYFQGLLESIAGIERTGYEILRDLGAPYPKRVLTAGGGSENAGWIRIREQRLGVPVTAASNVEAAFGAARLARQGLKEEK